MRWSTVTVRCIILIMTTTTTTIIIIMVGSQSALSEKETVGTYMSYS